MERSSPLATMHPQSLPFENWNFRPNAPTSDPQYGGRLGFGPSSFDFRDLSMKKPSSDYFNIKPIRGSSPAASLAADLSQNFHIDKSPQLPTPRRSLFTSNLFGTLNGRETIITPPLPSSSPGPNNDSMDISPLPHKVPFCFPARINVQSPTPEPTPVADCMLSSPNALPESPLEIMRAPALVERRRPAALRPSLSRAKGLSTNSISLASPGHENQPPPFKFGSGTLSATASLLSLEECFVESPQQTAFSNPSPTIGPPRPKTAFPTPGGFFPRNSGSPLVGIRKPSGPVQRPRKQFRRSLSMFEHPADVMKREKEEQGQECGLQSIMDTDDNPQMQLPHFIPETETIPRISKETMIDLLDGKYSQCYDNSLIIDCRFEYEYKGGHIEGAINFNNKEELATRLFGTPSSQRTLLVFHCEYSAHRAPIAARHIRHEDRATNVHQYPRLTYPEVYILDGGYSAFFKDHQTRCFPQNYVEMNDKEHENACERGLGRMKQQRAKLGRAHTFAFGSHNHSMDDSPTAIGRNHTGNDFMMGVEISIDSLALRRGNARRMASY